MKKSKKPSERIREILEEKWDKQGEEILDHWFANVLYMKSIVAYLDEQYDQEKKTKKDFNE